MMDKRSFYQWDLDQRLALNDVAVGTEVHFCNPVSKDTECLTVFAYEDNGAVYVDVPNVILQIAGSFKVYVWPFHTTQYHQFTVITRPKPADYIYEEVEIYTIKTAVDKALAEAKESGVFDGKDGQDGYTPKRGVDYWTAADKREMKKYIDDEIGNIEEAIDEIIKLQESLLPTYEYDLFVMGQNSTDDAEPNVHYVGDGTFRGCRNGVFTTVYDEDFGREVVTADPYNSADKDNPYILVPYTKWSGKVHIADAINPDDNIAKYIKQLYFVIVPKYSFEELIPEDENWG